MELRVKSFKRGGNVIDLERERERGLVVGRRRRRRSAFAIVVLPEVACSD